jgi:microcystin-dependent protein
MALGFTLTDAGRAALRNADGDGTRAVRVAAVSVTATAFAPGEPPPNEYKRLATISGGATAPDTIHVTITDATEGDVYSVRGFGFYLDDGTLLGSYGQAEVIVEKSANSTMQLAVDVQFAQTDATQITFGDTNFMNPVATIERLGVVELATVTEAKAGKDAERAITPATLLAALDSRLGANAPTLFVKTLLALASAAEFRDAIGPQFPPVPHIHAMNDVTGLVSALASKLDVRARYVPGQIIVSASKTAPPNTLLCNGAAVSRKDYADLFAAIGTTYGTGDGLTTFNIPALGEGTGIKATIDPQKVGTYHAGSVLTHTHGATAAGVGDHAHTVTLTAAGGHAHGASETAAGDHVHGAWTDGQGWHQHSGGTSGVGDHAHIAFSNAYNPVIDLGGIQGNIAYRGDGSGPRLWSPGGNQVTTGGGGSHAHSFVTDGNGNHAHNIGMNGAGGHVHTISIAAVGDHNHNASASQSGAHTHTITVAAAGDSANLAAGTYMFHFIAY